MTLARAKPGGYTDDLDVLPASELNTIDINASRGIDGTDGGDYSPGNPVRIDDLEMPGTSRLKYASRSIVRYQPLGGTPASTDWVRNFSSGNIGAWRQVGTTLSDLLIPITKVVSGSVLSSVSVRWRPAGVHAGEPGNMPQAWLYRVTEGAPGTFTAIANTTIVWPGSAGAYEVDQDVVLTPSSYTPNLALEHLLVRFRGENGANALAAGEVIGVKVAQAVVEQDELT